MSANDLDGLSAYEKEVAKARRHLDKQAGWEWDEDTIGMIGMIASTAAGVRGEVRDPDNSDRSGVADITHLLAWRLYRAIGPWATGRLISDLAYTLLKSLRFDGWPGDPIPRDARTILADLEKIFELGISVSPARDGAKVVLPLEGSDFEAWDLTGGGA